MLFDSAEELVEMFRTSYTISFLVFVPILFLISPACATTDFPVYRMQHYDLQGASHGCRSAMVSAEVRPLEATSYTRKCVVTRLKDFSISKFKEIVQQNAGGVLILLPNNLTDVDKEEKKQLMEIEHELLNEEVQIPIYLTHETNRLSEIYENIRISGNTDGVNSAFEAILNSANMNGFQFVVNGQSRPLSDFEIVNIQGKLAGYGMEEQLPTILVVAHYDALGIAPSLSFGTDSNGSGVVAILELVRLFSKLYTSSRSHARYNMQFLLSGGGKFNYQGTKRWLEDQLEVGELGDVSFVVCLDTIGSGDKLFAHVSKPPKEGSSADKFIKDLESALKNIRGAPEKLESSVCLEMVHKKINLAEDYLAWEHERFSIQKKSALTLSALEGHKDLKRSTIFDDKSEIDVKTLSLNIRAVAEALSLQIYNISSDLSDVFLDGMSVNEESVESWIDYLSGKSRATQLMVKDAPELSTLEQTFNKYLKDVRRHSFKADKRDPEFVFYSGSEYIMSSYSVKPAVFDLFLAVGIFSYLAMLYLLSQSMHIFYPILSKLSGSRTIVKKVQ